MFNEQLNSGIIERVSDAVPRDGTHYLPYHFVIKEGKSTPLRIVHRVQRIDQMEENKSV
mgnify:CR=1 FL=1